MLSTIYLIALFSSVSITVAQNGKCPDGSNPVNCFVQPCAQKPCLTAAGEEQCVDDYCGGCSCKCQAGFALSSNGKCEKISAAGCPDGSNPVNCFVQPCAQKPCLTAAGEEQCVDDYCGGCNCKCQAGFELSSNGKCEKISAAGCPDGSNPVNCFVQPCAQKPCLTAAGEEQCVDDYCGGCNCKCQAGFELSSNGKCERKCLTINCDQAPCTGKPCREASGAEKCIDNYCTGCNCDCGKGYTMTKDGTCENAEDTPCKDVADGEIRTLTDGCTKCICKDGQTVDCDRIDCDDSSATEKSLSSVFVAVSALLAFKSF